MSTSWTKDSSNMLSRLNDDQSAIFNQPKYKPILKPYKMVSLGKYVGIKEKIKENGKSIKVIYSKLQPYPNASYYLSVDEQKCHLNLKPVQRLVQYLKKQKPIKNLHFELQETPYYGNFKIYRQCFQFLKRQKTLESLNLSLIVTTYSDRIEVMNKEYFDNLLKCLQNCKLKSLSLFLINSDIDIKKSPHQVYNMQPLFDGYKEAKSKLFKIIGEQEQLKYLEFQIGLERMELENDFLPCLQNLHSLKALKIHQAQIKPQGSEYDQILIQNYDNRYYSASDLIPLQKEIRDNMNILFKGIGQIENLQSLSVDFTGVQGRVGWQNYHVDSVIQDFALVLEQLQDKLTSLEIKFAPYNAVPEIEGQEMESEFLYFSQSLAKLQKLKQLRLDFTKRTLNINNEEEELLISNGISALVNLEELDLTLNGCFLCCVVGDRDDVFISLDLALYTALLKLQKLHSISLTFIDKSPLSSFESQTREKLSSVLSNLSQLKSFNLYVFVKSGTGDSDICKITRCILDLKQFLTSFTFIKANWSGEPYYILKDDIESFNNALEILMNIGKLKYLNCNMAFPWNMQVGHIISYHTVYNKQNEDERIIKKLYFLINKINRQKIFNLEDAKYFSIKTQREVRKQCDLEAPAIQNIKYQRLKGERIKYDEFRHLNSYYDLLRNNH